MQTVPAMVVLGDLYTGQSIGYRVDNLDGTAYTAFTTTNVTETSVFGNYVVNGGVNVPDNGGYIIFGLSGQDLAETIIEPSGDGKLYQELSSVPDDSATISEMIQWLYAMSRNKIAQNGTKQTLYADNDTTVIAEANTSYDGTTVIRGKFE